MSLPVDVLHLSTRLATARDAQAAQSALDEFAAYLGADTYNAVLFFADGHAKPTYMVRRLPAGFESVSDDNDAARQDPVMQALRTESRPICWGRDDYRDPGHAPLYEEIADHGVCNGVATALHLARRRNFLIGFDWSGDAPRTSLSREALHVAVQTAAVFAEPALFRLALEKAAGDGLPGELDGSLTRRELQVLHWVAKGMTDQVAADILKISPRTVRKHVDSAISKLGASNRVEAAVKATRRGLLDHPPPVDFA